MCPILSCTNSGRPKSGRPKSGHEAHISWPKLGRPKIGLALSAKPAHNKQGELGRPKTGRPILGRCQKNDGLSENWRQKNDGVKNLTVEKMTCQNFDGGAKNLTPKK